jgi:beta-ketoacyl-acyl-carrier-protein synthase II
MGAISPLGLDIPSMWKGLIQGRSGIGPITLFHPESLGTKIAAEVKGFDPLAYIGPKEARRTDRFTQFAIAASLQAVEQARLKLHPGNGEEVGVIIGSGIGGIMAFCAQYKVLMEKGWDRLNPFLISMVMPDAASAQVSIILGAKGANFCTVSACASGADAIGQAYEIIRRGDAQAMVTGGSEALITPICVGGFNAAHALSRRNHEPQKASRPFDAERDGFVIGEGAAILVLEDLHFALKRGAIILAEVVAYGATSDAYHTMRPDERGEGGARAIQITLRKAKVEPREIDYINAHGTSTLLNDKSETMAIKAAFGSNAYHIPISSTKSMIGHLIGAAGAIEAVICVLTIQHGVIPPTINLVYPDPDCDLDYVPNVCRQARVKTALSNSFGFGGHNSVLIFREYTEGE